MTCEPTIEELRIAQRQAHRICRTARNVLESFPGSPLCGERRSVRHEELPAADYEGRAPQQ